MNIWDLVLIAALAGAVLLAVRRVRRLRKSGGCACGGSCCGDCAACSQDCGARKK